MTSSSKTIALASLAGALAINAGALRAADARTGITMKPLHGISFDIGTQRAVSFFTSHAGACRLVLATAEPFSADDSFATARFETAVPAGGSKQLKPVEGAAVEFSCADDAQSMTARIVSPIAIAQAR